MGLYKNITWKGEGFEDMKYQRNLSLDSSEPGLGGEEKDLVRCRYKKRVEIIPN